MSQTKPKLPTIYNPSSQSPEEIASNFVIRLDEFEQVFQTVSKDKMHRPPQHFMIQGQRGYGKTTILLRLKHEITSDPGLNPWLLPVMFDEEQYSVHTLAKLWEEAIDILADQYECFAGLTDKIDPLYDKESPEEEIFDLLTKALKKEHKKVVLLLDNFGEMVAKFTKKENQRLREVLITSSQIRIIATSSAILEFYYNYREPFFDFFKVITLDELDRDETIALLQTLGRTYGTNDIEEIIQTQPERVEALRRLTGGVPRTIVLLFEIFVDNVDGSSFRDLEAILDKVTPLYKHRMDDLPVQQQIIVDALAQNWDAMSAGEIARKVRLPSKAVSSQLNILERSQLVRKIPTSTKNQLYQISERFFNIYYLMRLGRRKNRNRVLWLVKFFELWCGEKELVDRTQSHIKSLRQGKLYPPHAYWLSHALSRTHLPDELQHELITQTREYLSSANHPLAKELGKSHIEMLNETAALIENDNIDSASRKLLKEGFSQDRVDLHIGNVLAIIKKDYRRAIEFFLRAIDRGNTYAMYNLAYLYESQYKDHEQAKKYYQMAVEKGLPDAMYNLALLYDDEYKDYEKAEAYYLMAIEKGHILAMSNLGYLYENEYEDNEKAEKYLLMAAEKGDVYAKNNLASLYFFLGKNRETALRLQKEAFTADREGDSALGYVLTLLWNNEIEGATKVYVANSNDENVHRDVNELVTFVFMMFLAKKQYTFVYRLFEENKFNIRDKYKPVYFALLSLLGDKYKDELLKMGSELEDTVDEVLSRIKRLEVEYA